MTVPQMALCSSLCYPNGKKWGGWLLDYWVSLKLVKLVEDVGFVMPRICYRVLSPRVYPPKSAEVENSSVSQLTIQAACVQGSQQTLATHL